MSIPESAVIEQAHAAILRIEALLEAAGVPLNLKDIDVRPEHFERIAASAVKTTRLVVNNPAPMTYDSVIRLLQRGYDGDRGWWEVP